MTDSKLSERDVSGMLSANSLLYETIPQSISVVQECNYRKIYPTKTSYTVTSSGVMDFHLNLGNLYPDLYSAFVEFDLQQNGRNKDDDGNNAGAVFDTCGVPSIIRNGRISHRSGKLVQEERRANVKSNYEVVYDKSLQWRNSVGSISGYNSTVSATTVSATFASGTDKKVVLPLHSVLPFFTRKDQLCPSLLSSGMNLKLTLESPSTAFKLLTADDTITNYVISNPVLHIKCYKLADAFHQAIVQSAANNGLDFWYPSTDETTYSGAGTSFDVEVRASLSRVLGVMTVPRRQPGKDVAGDDLTNGEKSVNSFASIATTNFQDYQYYIGNISAPCLQPVDSTTQAYWHALDLYDKIRDDDRLPSVSGTTFDSTFNAFCANLERSSTLSLQGLPVSNQRSLTLKLRYTTGNSKTIELNVFTKYLTVAKVFVDRVLVKS